MITKKKEELKTKKLKALSLLLLFGAVSSFGLDALVSGAVPPERLRASALEAVIEEVRPPADPFLNIALKARAAYVFDLTTDKVLFARNEQEKLPLASVTKLMTTLVAREHMSENMVVTITADDLSAEGDSGLHGGERWRLGGLLDVMLLVSSNDAAHTVARFIGESKGDSDATSARAHFVALMNEKARALGLSSMEFFNASGLDVNQAINGGYGSARETALLIGELWKKFPESLEITMRKDARIYSQDNIVHILPNTNEAIGHFPGLLASKTGFTNLAGGNLAMIVDRGVGSPIIFVVLGSGYKERFEDMQALVGAMRKVAF